MDSPSKLDEQKIVGWLQSKWGANPCPMCKVSQWIVQNSAFQLVAYTGAGFIIGGPVLPVVPVTCGNCGNTVFVNAVLSGAVQASPTSGISAPAEKTP